MNLEIFLHFFLLSYFLYDYFDFIHPELFIKFEVDFDVFDFQYYLVH